MADTPSRQLPDLTKALRRFKQNMDECARDCEEAQEAVRQDDDKFWNSLWERPTLWTIIFGSLGAILPIGALMLWHASRGGTFIF